MGTRRELHPAEGKHIWELDVCIKSAVKVTSLCVINHCCLDIIQEFSRHSLFTENNGEWCCLNLRELMQYIVRTWLCIRCMALSWAPRYAKV
jgi:hypothetical protein